MQVAVNEKGYRIGESRRGVVLTDREVERMRDLHEVDGYGYKRLAKIFEVSLSSIASICRYERRNQTIARWKTVP